MSFILDALKKSEADRQQQASGEFSSIPTAAGSAGPPRWIWALGALLLLNVVVLVALATRGKDNDSVARVPEEAATETLAPTRATVEQGFADRLRESRPPPQPTVRDEEPSGAASQPARAAAPAEPDPGPGAGVVDTASSPQALPTLTEIRLNDGVQLPDMNLDIHVYGESAADRFVFIDMKKLQEGDTLETGASLEEITPGGVIMNYRGTRFMLPRE